MLRRYESEVTPRKRSAHVERCRIGLICRHSIAMVAVGLLTPAIVSSYRDARLRSVSGETVRQDLVLLRQVIETARREWDVPLPRNPVDDVTKPKGAIPRDRRLRTGEYESLCAALAATRNPTIRDVVQFALATGMRRSEILRLVWHDINWTTSTLAIRETKNGHPRVIPLAPEALALLQRRRFAEGFPEGSVFGVSANAVKLAWRRVVARAAISDLRFHDLRHEAVSRFFELGLSVPEVALISGHRDVRQLMRYTHLRAVNVASKLARAAPASETSQASSKTMAKLQ
jgi:integrase